MDEERGGSRGLYFLTLILVPLKSCNISQITQDSDKGSDKGRAV